jgi:very-short-patch-repair endonuclease/uncharacterized Zn-finger protein
MVTPGSSKKVWWKCEKGHEWENVIGFRRNHRCPYCSNRKIGSDNNLAVLNPTLANEWHPTKNGKLSPKMVTPGSSKKVWWKCDKHHDWEARISDRKNTGCPYCSNQSSEPEIRILTELMSIFDDVTSRHKIKSLELDIYIPFYDLGIEYDGSYYHKDKEFQDKNKNKVLAEEGIKIVRIRHHPLKPISSLDVIHVETELTKEKLNQLMSTIKLLVDQNHIEKINSYLLETEFVNQALFQEYMSYFPDPFPENSLKHLFPTVCKEWNYEKNKPLVPANFSPGSNKKVWWKCDKDHEWEAVIEIRTRTNQPSACPYCAGQKTGSDNNLAFLNPTLANEWHPTKNGELTPNMVTLSSHKKAWWVCGKGHEWEAVIYSRKNRGCPYCAGKRFKI